MLSNAVFKNIDEPHLYFTLYDQKHAIALNDHLHIHMLQLDKWEKPETLQSEDLWLYSLKEGKYWKELPEELRHIDVFEAFMSTLHHFSDREVEYDLYRRRQEFRRIEISEEAEKADALKEKADALKDAAEANIKLTLAEKALFESEEKAEAEKVRAEAAEVRAKAAEAEIAQLRAQLNH